MSRFGPSVLPQHYGPRDGSFIADALEGLRQTRRQERHDRVAEEQRAIENRRAAERDRLLAEQHAREQTRHEIELWNEGYRRGEPPAGAGGTADEIAAGVEAARAGAGPRIGVRGPQLEEPAIAGAAGAPNLPGATIPVQPPRIVQAGQQFYRVAGGYIDPTQTREARQFRRQDQLIADERSYTDRVRGEDRAYNDRVRQEGRAYQVADREDSQAHDRSMVSSRAAAELRMLRERDRAPSAAQQVALREAAADEIIDAAGGDLTTALVMPRVGRFAGVDDVALRAAATRYQQRRAVNPYPRAEDPNSLAALLRAAEAGGVSESTASAPPPAAASDPRQAQLAEQRAAWDALAQQYGVEETRRQIGPRP